VGWAWVFTAKGEKRNDIDLFQAPSVKIKRWPRIKAAASVYDPEWEVHFERRQQKKMVGKFVGHHLLSYLYRQQADKCAHCHPAITTETGWDRHHRHPKHRGGKDSDDNLVLLHPNCHEPVHHEGRQLERPPPRCRTARKETGQVL